MIGRAIDCEIQRNLHSAFAHLFLQPIKVLKCAERRLDCLVSAGLAADRPWHARVARLAGDRVVSAFAIGVTDRMNRRKINEIKPHRLCIRHPRQTFAGRRPAIPPALPRPPAANHARTVAPPSPRPSAERGKNSCRAAKKPPCRSTTTRGT